MKLTLERILPDARRRRAIALAAVALALDTIALPARAQTAPAGAPIKLIVPFTPGTGIDLIARQIGPRLAERLGRPVVVENRSGASGNLGTEAVVRAAADGSTLLVTVNTLVMNRALYPNLSFDAVRDLDAVTLTSWGQLVLVAHPKTGITTADDLIARAKSRPGALNYGSPGNGTPHHLAMELVKNQARVFITHIPYRGTGPALTDLLAGRTHAFSAGTPALLPHIKAGRLRAIAMGTAQRLPALPDVPTVAEMGYKDFETSQWYGILAPAGTPPEIVKRLQEESLKALKSSSVTERFANDSAVGGGGPSAEFAAFIAQQQKIWKDIVQRAGIKPD